MSDFKKDKAGTTFDPAIHRMKKNGQAIYSKGEFMPIVKPEPTPEQKIEQKFATENLTNNQLAKQVRYEKPTREALLAHRRDIEPEYKDSTYTVDAAPERKAFEFDYDVKNVDELIRGEVNKRIRGGSDLLRVTIDHDEKTWHMWGTAGSKDSGTLCMPFAAIVKCAMNLVKTRLFQSDGEGGDVNKSVRSLAGLGGGRG